MGKLDERAVDHFFAAVRARLRRGALEYGDTSFDRPAGDLVAEIEAELHDVAGWAFVLCQRLHKLQRLAVRSDRVGSCGSMEDARPTAPRPRLPAREASVLQRATKGRAATMMVSAPLVGGRGDRVAGGRPEPARGVARSGVPCGQNAPRAVLLGVLGKIDALIPKSNTMNTATTQSELARALGVNRSTISRAARAGLPQLPDGTFDVEACRAWLGERLSNTRRRGPGAFDPRPSRRRLYR